MSESPRVAYLQMHDAEMTLLTIAPGAGVVLRLGLVTVYVPLSPDRFGVSLWSADAFLNGVRRVVLEGDLVENDYIVREDVFDDAGRTVRWAECMQECRIVSVRLEFFSGAVLTVNAESLRVRLIAEQKKRPDWEGKIE